MPVFWLATEDHDFAEVNHAWMFDAKGESQLLQVDANGSSARQRPVGSIAIDKPPLDALRGILSGMPFADEVIAAVEAAYVPGGAPWAQAFRTLLQSLTRNLGLIFLDPLDPAIRAIGAPLIAKAVSCRRKSNPG